MENFPQTPYFDGLIDDFGIWQHTGGSGVIREDGYSLNGATRALILTLLLNKNDKSTVLFNYIINSRSQAGFCGFADQNRNFLPTLATDDVIGQVIWVAGYAISKDFYVAEMTQLITEASIQLDKTAHIRGCAYALLGAVYVSKDLSEDYYQKLKSFFESTDDFWPWPEPTLSAGLGVVSYAFLRHGLINNVQESIDNGRRILSFIEEKCTFNRQRGPIGSDGWMNRGDNMPSLYSQLPSETAGMVWAWLAAYQSSANRSEKDHAELWMKWFDGENEIHAMMYDPNDLRCFDSIEPWGINYNSGSESNICFLLSKYMLQEGVTI